MYLLSLEVELESPSYFSHTRFWPCVPKYGEWFACWKDGNVIQSLDTSLFGWEFSYPCGQLSHPVSVNISL
jgi:hypothetical protein